MLHQIFDDVGKTFSHPVRQFGHGDDFRHDNFAHLLGLLLTLQHAQTAVAFLFTGTADRRERTLTVGIVTQGRSNGQFARPALLRALGTRNWGRTHDGNLLSLYPTTQFRQQVTVFTFFTYRGFASILIASGTRNRGLRLVGRRCGFFAATRGGTRWRVSGGLCRIATGLNGLLFFFLLALALRFSFRDLTLFIGAATVSIFATLTQLCFSQLLLAAGLFLFAGPLERGHARLHFTIGQTQCFCRARGGLP